MSLFLVSILCGMSFAATPVIPPQYMALQKMHIQQELTQISGTLAEKNQQKMDLESQLQQLASPLSAAKALRMNSKTKQLSQAEAQIKNQLQQLKIEIKELKMKQAAMTASLTK